jgi:ABC-type multidrug transport system permease subunit
MSMQDMLHRKHMFQVRYVKSGSQLSVESFYLISMVLLLILLTGVMCAGSFIRSDYSLAQLLNLRRLGSFRQVLAEYISLIALLSCLGVLFFPLIGAVLGRMPITFSAFGLTPESFLNGFLLFCLKAFPVILLAAAIDLFLYELSKALITGVLLQFLVMIVLAYLSGVFYTVQSMPGTLKAIQPFLPTGQALLYLQATARGKTSVWMSLLLTLAWAALFLIGSFLLRKSNVSGKRGGR